MKRRLLPLLTLFCLTASLTLSAGAAEYADFSDVDNSTDYAEAIQWAAEQGYINGYSDERFGVNDPVTRAQTAAIFYRAAGSPDASAEDYTDESAIAAYARTAVDWFRSSGILAGLEDGRFAPNDSATRAEVVSALYQYRTRPDSGGQETNETEENAMPQLKIEVGGQTFTATLLDNPTTRALLDRLPITVSMEELNGNEKYYYIPESLPNNPQRPGNIHAGELMLYGSDCLVLFYESFSSGYSYTRLGSVDDPTGLVAALGSGSVEVTFFSASDDVVG